MALSTDMSFGPRCDSALKESDDITVNSPDWENPKTKLGIVACGEDVCSSVCDCCELPNNVDASLMMILYIFSTAQMSVKGIFLNRGSSKVEIATTLLSLR